MRPRKSLWPLWLAVGVLGFIIAFPAQAPAQEEVTSAIRRYRDREASTGYYEEYEVKPRRVRPFVGVPEVVRRYSPISPYRPRAAIEPSVRSRMEDSHAGIEFYELRRCEECHGQEAGHSHIVRGNLTCRQCHGGEPIAGINYYYSPLNPIRRHSYVCAKCHEGANVSFATFLIHEPKAGAAETRKTFPSLYYANWFMYLLILGTMVFFGLHTLFWVGKESYHAVREKKMKPEPKLESPPEQPKSEEPENE